MISLLEVRTDRHDLESLQDTRYDYGMLAPGSKTDLDGVVAPCLEVVPRVEVHLHYPVEGHAQELLLFLAHLLHQEEGEAEFWQRLPGSDELHLRLHQTELLDVSVGLQNARHALNGAKGGLKWQFKVTSGSAPRKPVNTN